MQVLKKNGFTVNSVVCKNGSIPKEFLRIQEQEKLRPNTYEPMCNPIGQAMALNKSQTDLNIILGLCVGHDTLFIKYSQAPVTVLAVKDRVLGHNLWRPYIWPTVTTNTTCTPPPPDVRVESNGDLVTDLHDNRATEKKLYQISIR